MNPVAHDDVGVGIIRSSSSARTQRTEAVVRVIWAMASAFLVALTAMMLGVEKGDLFGEHLPSLLGWGLVYFGGVAVGALLVAVVAAQSGEEETRPADLSE